MLVVVGDYRGDFGLLLQGQSVLYNSGVISLSLRSEVDEQMNCNLIWPKDLFSTLVAQSSTLQQYNFAPVATSDLTVCVTVLSLSLALPYPPCTYVLLSKEPHHYTTLYYMGDRDENVT